MNFKIIKIKFRSTTHHVWNNEKHYIRREHYAGVDKNNNPKFNVYWINADGASAGYPTYRQEVKDFKLEEQFQKKIKE